MSSPRFHTVFSSRLLDMLQFVLIALAFIVAMVLANSPYSRLYDSLIDTRVSGTWLAVAESHSPLYWLNEVLAALIFAWAAWFAGVFLREDRITSTFARIAAIAVAALPTLFLFSYTHQSTPLLANAAVVPAAGDPLILATLLGMLASWLSLPTRCLVVFVAAVQTLLLLAFSTSVQLDFQSWWWVLLFVVPMFALQRAAKRWAVFGLSCGLAMLLWWCLVYASAPAALAGAVLGFSLSRYGAVDQPLASLPYRAVGILVAPVFVVANGGVAIHGLDPSYIWRPEPVSFLLGAGLLKPVCIFILFLGLRRVVGGEALKCSNVTLLGLAALSAVSVSGAAYFNELSFNGVPGNYRFDLRLASLWIAAIATIVGAVLVMSSSKPAQQPLAH